MKNGGEEEIIRLRIYCIITQLEYTIYSVEVKLCDRTVTTENRRLSRRFQIGLFYRSATALYLSASTWCA